MFIVVCLLLLLFATYIVIQHINKSDNKEISTLEDTTAVAALRQMPTTKQYTSYTVELSIDQNWNSVMGIASITYTHEYEKATNQILMSARPIIIEDIQINSESVNFEQIDSTILINSPFTIQKGEELTITMQFNGIILDEDKDPSGIISVCNFLPTIMAYDEKIGWIQKNNIVEDSYRLVEPANYEVTVNTNGQLYPIGTGTINDLIIKDDCITVSFTAKRVRSFGLILGPKMERAIINTEVGTSIVLYYPLWSNKEDVTQLVKKSVTSYSDIFGTYPYEQLTVVHSEDIVKGFSWPTLIVGNFNILKPSYSDINQLMGQQWLYYIIGNSREKEYWLSTGLLEYINKSISLSDGQMKAYIEELKTAEMQKGRRYVYDKDEIAIRMLYEIEQKIGEEKFIEVLRAYYKNYSFQMATGIEFIQMVDKVTETNVVNIYNYWRHKMELKESE